MSKTTEAIEKKIELLNARYRKATPTQRRVLIAKDVLSQLDCGRYKAEPGFWTSVTPEPHWAEPLQPVLHRSKTRCSCCGVGAIFLSYVRLNNKATDSDGHDYWTIRARTGWPEQNLRLIEIAYERGHGKFMAFAAGSKAAAFASGLPPDERLRKIMNNIIRNKGTFKP